MKPVGDRWLDFVAVADLDDVEELGFGRAVDAAHLRSLEGATEEDAEFEEAPFRADEEVAGLAREHDGFVRGVDALIAEGRGGFAQALPSVAQIVGEIRGQRRFGRGPTVMRFSFLDPLFAVVALSTGHTGIICRGRQAKDKNGRCEYGRACVVPYKGQARSEFEEASGAKRCGFSWELKLHLLKSVELAQHAAQLQEGTDRYRWVLAGLLRVATWVVAGRGVKRRLDRRTPYGAGCC